MASFRDGKISADEGAEELGISDRWFRTLYGRYLEACAEGRAEEWEPKTSGGNRQRVIPEEVEELWRRMLGTKPPSPYNFAASEAFCDRRRESAPDRRFAVTPLIRRHRHECDSSFL